MEIGESIRRRRRELKLSLEATAGRTGLTPSFLSQIERGLASPSLDSLKKLGEALDVPIFYFLTERNPRGPLVRHDRRTLMKFPGSDPLYELLTPDTSRRMEVFMVEREPGHERIATELRAYTEEFIHVLQGELEIQIGDEAFTMGPGDSIYYEGPMLQRLVARGEVTLRFLYVITPPVF